MSSQPSKQEWLLGIVAFVLTGALWRFFSTGSEGSLDGDPRTQVVLAVLYFAVLILAFRNSKLIVWALFRTPSLPALLLLASLSCLWAENSSLVFRRSISLLGTSLFGIALAAHLTFPQQLKMLRIVFRVAAALSLAILILAPSHAMAADYGSGAARGIFTHKNLLGAAMAMGILVEWHLAEKRVLKAASIVVYAVLLVLSHSVTSIVTVTGTLLILWLFEKLHRKYRIPLSALLVFVAGLAICAFAFDINAGSFTGLLGRSSDLTGRTELWIAVRDMILTRPVLGFGFSGFWGGASSESVIVENYIGWSPTYSHNGYLEIMLSLGLFGAFLFFLLLRAGVLRALRQAEAKTSAEDLWPLSFFVFFILHNLAECTIVWQNCLEWALCIATAIGSDSQLQALLHGADEVSDSSVPRYLVPPRWPDLTEDEPRRPAFLTESKTTLFRVKQNR